MSHVEMWFVFGGPSRVDLGAEDESRSQKWADASTRGVSLPPDVLHKALGSVISVDDGSLFRVTNTQIQRSHTSAQHFVDGQARLVEPYERAYNLPRFDAKAYRVDRNRKVKNKFI